MKLGSYGNYSCSLSAFIYKWVLLAGKNPGSIFKKLFGNQLDGMCEVEKGSWKDREVGKFQVGKFFPSSLIYMWYC